MGNAETIGTVGPLRNECSGCGCSVSGNQFASITGKCPKCGDSVTDQKFQISLSDVTIKGMILGFIVDIGGSILASIITGAVFGAILAHRAGSSEEIVTLLESNIALNTILFLIPAIFIFIGGLVVGRIAANSKIMNAGLYGGLKLMLVAFFLWILPLPPEAFSLSGFMEFVITIPLALAGGYTAMRLWG